jgi:nucleoside-diphosphate-sugar epimerase
MKYIITGAGGHISGPLTEKLLKAKHQVTLIGRSGGSVENYRQKGATLPPDP